MRAPDLSWDATFDMTKNEFECIPDLHMFIFFEKGMTGGISDISNRYSKASNKSLKTYDPRQESKHIIYFDTNNLYGYAMSKFLPTSRLKWIDPKECDLNKYTSNSTENCILEVELRKLNNDYPSTSNKIEIKK